MFKNIRRYTFELDSISIPANPIQSSFHGENKETGIWANFGPMSWTKLSAKGFMERSWNVLRPQYALWTWQTMSCHLWRHGLAFTLLENPNWSSFHGKNEKKLGFGPSLAQYHGQKDPWSDHETFWGCSTCDRHDKQSTDSMSSHVIGPFAPLARSLALLTHSLAPHC